MTKIKAKNRNKNKTILLSQPLSPRGICYSWCSYDINITKQPHHSLFNLTLYSPSLVQCLSCADHKVNKCDGGEKDEKKYCFSMFTVAGKEV